MAAPMRYGQDWLNLVLGVWLMLSPVFGVGTGATAASLNAGMVGLVVATVAMFSLSRPHLWQEWTNLALGLWLMVAPAALGFAGLTQAVWNHFAVGASVTILAGWALSRRWRRRRTAGR